MNSVKQSMYNVLLGNDAMPELRDYLLNRGNYTPSFFNYRLCSDLKIKIDLNSTESESFLLNVRLKGLSDQDYLDLSESKKADLRAEEARLVQYAMSVFFYAQGFESSEFTVSPERKGDMVELSVRTYLTEKGFVG